MLVSPSIQYINLLGIHIYIYGIVLALAIFVAVKITDTIAKKEYNIDFIYEQSIFIILSGLIGARLYYCLVNFNTYLENPLRILNIREGGLSIHGAIIAGILAIFLFSKKYNINFFKLCDLYALTMPLAQAIGRWGNFFNSEAYGLPTNSILKLYVSPEFRVEQYEQFNYFHPTFLYESVLNFLLFLFLYFFILKRYKNHYGIISGAYLTIYAIIRILIEPLRLDCTTYIGIIPLPIIVSIIMLILGITIIGFSLKDKLHSSK